MEIWLYGFFLMLLLCLVYTWSFSAVTPVVQAPDTTSLGFPLTRSAPSVYLRYPLPLSVLTANMATVQVRSLHSIFFNTVFFRRVFLSLLEHDVFAPSTSTVSIM